jgi:MFS family permease
MSDTTAPKAHDPYQAFRFRDYRFYAAGNLLSVMGRQMVAVAIGWEVYQRTHAIGKYYAASMLGYVGLTLALPVILFAIPAGQTADRYQRRKILLVTQLLTSLSSVGLVVWSYHHAGFTWMFTLLFLSSISRTFSWAARTPFMSNLVPADVLNNAVTWNSSLFQGAAVIGPALGGILLSRLGFPFIYGLDACFALTFFALLLPISYRKENLKAAAQGWSALFSGIRFVFQTKIILATITLDLFAVLFGGATALLPIFADQILHCGAIGLGWLRAAPSMGSVAMGLLIAYMPPMKNAGKSMLHAVTWFGIGTIVFGLSKSFYLSMAALIVTGAADSVSVIVRHTLVQLLTPDTMRGRVSAVNNVFIGSSNELGAFESGMTAAWFGPVISVVGGGIATILVVIATMKKWPQVMGLGTFASMKPMEAEPQPPPCNDELRMTEDKEE